MFVILNLYNVPVQLILSYRFYIPHSILIHHYLSVTHFHSLTSISLITSLIPLIFSLPTSLNIHISLPHYLDHTFLSHITSRPSLSLSYISLSHVFSLIPLSRSSLQIYLSLSLITSEIPANTWHLYNICTMLDQRRRRWAYVVQMLYKCFVFAGMLLSHSLPLSHFLIFVHPAIRFVSVVVFLLMFSLNLCSPIHSSVKEWMSAWVGELVDEYFVKCREHIHRGYNY